MSLLPRMRREPSEAIAFDARDADRRTCLFDVSVGKVEDVRSAGAPTRGPIGTESFSPEFQVALPYRGFFVWHVGRDEVAGDINQALFITGGEGYRMSHPVAGGYAELIVTPTEEVIAELAHGTRGALRFHPLFRRRSCRLTPRVQSFRARFLAWADRTSRGASTRQRNGASPDAAHEAAHDARASARTNGATPTVDSLIIEDLLLALVRSAIHEDRAIERPAYSTQRLIRRTKTFLAAEFAKPIRLIDVGRAVGASPLYLTQVFRQIEGIPLHQYLTQLRLAHALAMLPRTEDLTTLALDVGFSSHSHFSSRFRRAFGMTPSQFRETSRRGAPPAAAV